MNSTSSSPSNLLFLLAAAPLGLGCIIVADGDEDTTGADSSNPTTTSNATTDAATGGNDTEVATSGATGGSTGAEGSTGVDPTGGVDDTTGGAADPCADYGALYDECFPQYKQYYYAENYCNNAFEYGPAYSDECGIAVEELYACLNTLTCKELPVSGGAGCAEELAAIIGVCPSFE